MAGTKNSYALWSKEAGAKILETTSAQPGPILISLQALQNRFGFVHDEAVELVALACNASRAEVHGVLTFYHDLRRTPSPKQMVHLCVAEACQAVGSRELVAEIENSLRVNIGQTHSEVELQEKYCFGNCALGPSATVNGRLIGHCTVEKIRALLASPESA